MVAMTGQKPSAAPAAHAHTASAMSVRRITSSDLLQDGKAVEIEHAGKVYRLRVTQLNKLILTA
jgi:hemin uptake protein HemP